MLGQQGMVHDSCKFFVSLFFTCKLKGVSLWHTSIAFFTCCIITINATIFGICKYRNANCKRAVLIVLNLWFKYLMYTINTLSIIPTLVLL